MSRRRVWVLLCAVCAVGIAIGAAWPPPPLPRSTTSDNTWSLPSVADIERHVPKDMATVTSGMRWNGETDSLKAGATTWRLAGITGQTSPAILVMTPQNQAKAQRISLGEPLPDGSILKVVEGDRALTQRGNCIMTYQLFHAQAIEKSAGCGEADASDQGQSK